MQFLPRTPNMDTFHNPELLLAELNPLLGWTNHLGVEVFIKGIGVLSHKFLQSINAHCIQALQNIFSYNIIKQTENVLEEDCIIGSGHGFYGIGHFQSQVKQKSNQSIKSNGSKSTNQVVK